MTRASNATEYHTIIPYLIVRGVGDLMNFLARAFNAQEVRRETRPDGSIMHAEVRIGIRS